MWSMWFW
ncbi:hypothetical protein TIFTF001_019402, partial [Ficus carica]